MIPFLAGAVWGQEVSVRCEATMERVTGHYSQCLVGAAVQYARHGNATKLENRKTRCQNRFERRTDRSVRRYGASECTPSGLISSMAVRAEDFAEAVAIEAAGQPVLDLFFVESAEGGSLTESTLVLNGVNETTGWFASRPDRLAGQITTEEFVSLWDAGTDSFANHPPHAEFTCEVDGKVRNYVVELTEPLLAGGELSYAVSLVPTANGPFDAGSLTCDGEAHLFINPGTTNFPGQGSLAGPTPATVSVGILGPGYTIHTTTGPVFVPAVIDSLNRYGALLPKNRDLLPTTIALPVVLGVTPKECETGGCAAGVKALKEQRVSFAFADTDLMGTKPPSIKTLTTTAQAYGLTLSEVQAYILQGAKGNLANYASLSSTIKLGFFNESTSYNAADIIWQTCDSSWVIAAIYADGVYGGKPLVTASSDCYCNSDPTTVAASMQFNYGKQCPGPACGMPLALSFEECKDQTGQIRPLLGYSGKGQSPLSESPKNLRAFLTAIKKASNTPIVYYRLEFALLRIAGKPVPADKGCSPPAFHSCEEVAPTCPSS